ncbi:MAG: transglycosylase SLT domain-containing protein [Dysgonamonadaceae bacterium]|jgi:membrane-bound lytic murein transglycosylase F|nr:transglycosylase SLT domain-containing protein [Dysgonamonadaceae bacterium]
MVSGISGKSRRWVWVVVIGLFLTGCKNHHRPVSVDLPQIEQQGELHVLTLSGSMSYFIYKGEPRGYEYELLRDFADTYGLKVNIRLAENETRLTEMLLRGEGDLIAYPFPVTNPGKAELLYCGREVVNHQVLIQRSNKGDTLLKDVTGLIGKEVWVIHDSKQYQRMVYLNDELGGGIRIRTIDKDTVTVEDLIEMVAKGQISYTVSDGDMARLNKTYFQNLNISLPVSHPQRSSWAVRKTSPHLASALDEWFRNNRNTPHYRSLIKRYFEMSKMPGDAPAPLLGPHRISLYDAAFKHYAQSLGWDWRLLASIAYQESKFYTDRVSWAGATGLMGLMPKTAEAFGLPADSLDNPEGSIRAATGLIRRLDRAFSSVEDADERIKFVLAAYNAGASHIYDAQALAGKYGKNPLLWENHVEEYLKLKSLPEYYNDSLVQQGYFRSTETVNYVQAVVERWRYYQEKIQ